MKPMILNSRLSTLTTSYCPPLNRRKPPVWFQDPPARSTNPIRTPMRMKKSLQLLRRSSIGRLKLLAGNMRPPISSKRECGKETKSWGNKSKREGTKGVSMLTISLRKHSPIVKTLRITVSHLNLNFRTCIPPAWSSMLFFKEGEVLLLAILPLRTVRESVPLWSLSTGSTWKLTLLVATRKSLMKIHIWRNLPNLAFIRVSPLSTNARCKLILLERSKKKRERSYSC